MTHNIKFITHQKLYEYLHLQFLSSYIFYFFKDLKNN